MNIDFPKAMPYYFYFWRIGVAFLFKLLVKTDNYITSGHVTQGAELYKQIRGCGICWVLSDKVPTSPPPHLEKESFTNWYYLSSGEGEFS